MQFPDWFNTWQGTFRQWSYPPAFRIDMRAYGEQEAMELEVPRLTDAVVEESLSPAAAPPSVAPAAQAPVDDSHTQQFLAQLCTALWRARSKMVDASGQPTPEVRRAYRHVQASWDLLREYGLEVLDHTDEPYDSGQALKVLSLEKRTDIAQARVLETVVPTVYLRSQSIQMGEVIVLVPEDALGRNTRAK
jgi:hypothetical protein